jgi:hypothetical protein
MSPWDYIVARWNLDWYAFTHFGGWIIVPLAIAFGIFLYKNR